MSEKKYKQCPSCGQPHTGKGKNCRFCPEPVTETDIVMLQMRVSALEEKIAKMDGEK